MKSYFVYILANFSATLYIGVTNNLERRFFEHKFKVNSGFTEKYNISKLVYFEEYKDINEAIAREKQLKKWSRVKKINLIKVINPEFKDLLTGNEISRLRSK